MRTGFSWANLALPAHGILACAVLVCTILSPTLAHASGKKQLPAVRWTAGARGCTFESGDDGRYRWTMTGKDLTITMIVDSQELTKSRRFYRLLGAYISATYTGQGKLEFPADVRMDFVRHHDILESYQDPTELSNRLQNDVDTLVFETERKIKKNPSIGDEKTAAYLREYEKDASEFIEFVTTQGLETNTVILSPANPEIHGWVFFATSNKWIGPWKEREDFILGVWMKDRIWQFPFSLPPTEGDLILRKPPE